MARIKNWTRFQHFKDRRPPWIKLYRDLLDDIEWHQLDGATAKALVMIWLIASESEGTLPELRELAFRLRTSESQAKTTISKLSHWLEHDDIKPISDQHQSDSKVKALTRSRETEEETEREKEAEVAASASHSSPAKVNGNSVCYIPLVDGSEFGVTSTLAHELAGLYPAVDVKQTLNEIRGWNLANPKRRKTAGGVVAHINSWMQKEQNRG